jgi:hypothetical protein
MGVADFFEMGQLLRWRICGDALVFRIVCLVMLGNPQYHPVAREFPATGWT